MEKLLAGNRRAAALFLLWNTLLTHTFAAAARSVKVPRLLFSMDVPATFLVLFFRAAQQTRPQRPRFSLDLIANSPGFALPRSLVLFARVFDFRWMSLLVCLISSAPPCAFLWTS